MGALFEVEAKFLLEWQIELSQYPFCFVKEQTTYTYKRREGLELTSDSARDGKTRLSEIIIGKNG